MNNIKKNFLYNTLYQIILILIPLLTTPYLSRVLGAEEIGRYSFSYSVANIFVIISLLGLNNYGNRIIAMKRDNSSEVSYTFCSVYAMQFMTSLAGFFVYMIYSFFFAHDRSISLLQGLYVISALFDINWLFAGMENFKFTVSRGIFVKIVSAVAIFIFVRSAKDVYLYTFIMSGSLLISQVWLFLQLRKYIKFHKVAWKDIRGHIRPNLVLFIPVLAISVYKIMDKVMLGFMTTNIEVGYYENAEKIIQIPMGFINSLGTVMLPRITNLIATNRKKESEDYLDKSIVFAILCASAMCFGIMAVADLFVPLFYGEGFEKCITLFWVLLPSCLFLAIANVIRTQYLIPNQRDEVYIKSVIIGAMVNVILNLILIPVLESTGAAVGTLCAEISVCFYQLYKIRSEQKVFQYIKIALPFVFSGIIMFVIVWNLSLNNMSMWLACGIKILVGVVLYTLFTIIFGKTTIRQYFFSKKM